MSAPTHFIPPKDQMSQQNSRMNQAEKSHGFAARPDRFLLRSAHPIIRQAQMPPSVDSPGLWLLFRAVLFFALLAVIGFFLYLLLA